MIGSGREKGGTSANGEQSWRELAGPRRRRINSPQARRRRLERLFKVALLFLALAAIVGAIIWSVTEYKSREEALPIKPPSKPIERILFQTNGVLPNKWLGTVVAIRPGMTMMEADIHQLKEAVEASGQVASASVERVFPSDLRIVVKERIPALRLAVMDGAGTRRQRLVSREGVVYDGIGYPKGTLQNLPFVQPFLRNDGGFFPLNGIERVAELLELAQAEAPDLYRTWKVVSLEHYSGDLDLPGQVIEVRTTLVPRIIFSASADYGRQMDRLIYILDYVQQRGNPSMEKIDLSLQNSAAVQFSSGRIGTF